MRGWGIHSKMRGVGYTQQDEEGGGIHSRMRGVGHTQQDERVGHTQ